MGIEKTSDQKRKVNTGHTAIEGTALGMIDWFDNTKGYGIVQSPMFGAVFVHIRSFPERPTAPLQRYQIISFRVEAEGNDGRLRARSSRLLEHPKGFTILMSLLDQEYKVTIDKESCCLLKYGTVQLFADQAEHIFCNGVCHFYDRNLDDRLFVDFCAYLENIALPLVTSDDRDLLEQMLYCHFHENLRAGVLFYTWKAGTFRYIGYTDWMEYEIPEEVINEYSSYMNEYDWERVKKYFSYAKD